MTTKSVAASLALSLALCAASVAFGQAGRGDPGTTRNEGLGNPVAIVADPYGDFIVIDQRHAGTQVWWATTDGRKQVITREVRGSVSLGWDMFADLLITNADGVYKLDPKGRVSKFITAENITDVALAPDGTLWLSTQDASTSFRHYDAFGNLIGLVGPVVPAGEMGPDHLAISSSGDIYYTAHGAVYRLFGSQGQRLFGFSATIFDIAVDVSGNVYVATGNGSPSGIYRYNATGSTVEAFATSPQATGVAFGRNGDGSMNSRLYFVDFELSQLIEANPSGVPARGAPVGFATPMQAVSELLRGGALNDLQRHTLDDVGNKNGRYDVGDLRAFLINTTTLSPAAPFGVGGKP